MHTFVQLPYNIIQNDYRVSCYILGTLQALFGIVSVNRFLKTTGGIDKEDCAINLRYQTSILVWRLFCLTSKKKIFFFDFFFRQSVYFYLKRRESEKKVLTKKFSPEVSKELRKIFFKSGSIPIMSFHNFCCWSCKFSNVKQKLTFYTLNWWRNPPCQFYLSFSKIDSHVLC